MANASTTSMETAVKNTPLVSNHSREGGARDGEMFSPSDRKIIRIDEYRAARMLRLRPAPTVHMPPWMMATPANDPNPPSSPAAARAA